jgi:hypothetical protein
MCTRDDNLAPASVILHLPAGTFPHPHFPVYFLLMGQHAHQVTVKQVDSCFLSPPFSLSCNLKFAGIISSKWHALCPRYYVRALLEHVCNQ